MVKTPSSKARAYSRFIPREDVGEFTLWRFAPVDGSEALLPKPQAAQQPVVDPEVEAAAAAQQAAEEAARKAQLQEQQQQQRDDAYAHGMDKGREDATIEWQQRLDDHIAGAGQEMAQRLDAVVQALDASLEAMRQHMAQDVLRLACDLARQVVRQELRTNPAALQPVVTEALDMLIADGRPATVRLNPADHGTVSAALRDQFPDTPVQWLADAQVPEGGCLVESAGTVVDGTLEKRWQRAITPLGLESAWVSDGATAAPQAAEVPPVVEAPPAIPISELFPPPEPLEVSEPSDSSEAPQDSFQELAPDADIDRLFDSAAAGDDHGE